MPGQSITYISEGKTLIGYFVPPKKQSTSSPAPGILIAHTWKGVDDFVKNKAQQLAELGYAAFACDLYGDGKVPKDDDEAEACMLPLFKDRDLLRKLVIAGYETLKKQQGVSSTNLAAIGFCFGGLTVIELLRSGVDIKGIVSFHGVLGYTLGGAKATPIPSKPMKGAALILHGNDDPLVTENDILSIKEEFTKAKIDWQFHIYGNTMHAFTNPAADAPETGLKFNEKANRRSWIAMNNFFNELLNKEDE